MTHLNLIAPISIVLISDALVKCGARVTMVYRGRLAEGRARTTAYIAITLFGKKKLQPLSTEEKLQIVLIVAAHWC